jgi:hypothetical protein
MLVVMFTFAGCFGTYEVIRRVKILRVLFGLGFGKEKPQVKSIPPLFRGSHSLLSSRSIGSICDEDFLSFDEVMLRR